MDWGRGEGERERERRDEVFSFGHQFTNRTQEQAFFFRVVVVEMVSSFPDV